MSGELQFWQILRSAGALKFPFCLHDLLIISTLSMWRLVNELKRPESGRMWKGNHLNHIIEPGPVVEYRSRINRDLCVRLDYFIVLQYIRTPLLPTFLSPSLWPFNFQLHVTVSKLEDFLLLVPTNHSIYHSILPKWVTIAGVGTAKSSLFSSY